MNLIHEQGRIYAKDPSGRTVAEVTFPRIGEKTADIRHTFVDESLRGQGAAGLLMRETARTLRSEGRKARLTCSYARQWFAQHPEEQDIVEPS